jgi:hypothetical protein
MKIVMHHNAHHLYNRTFTPTGLPDQKWLSTLYNSITDELEKC